MRASRFVVISLALALASAGCMRLPPPRGAAASPPTAPAASASVAAASAASMEAARIAAPPPAAAPQVVMGPGLADAASAANAMAAEPIGAPAYMLDSGDKLRVVVFGQDGLSNSYAVDAAGNITMPLIGAVSARAQTTSGLSQSIAGKLRNGYIREPHVAVEIEAYRPFFILGEVTAPGQYPYVASMTAETAIAIAGGFSPRAYKGTVEISRSVNGQLYRGKVPLAFQLRPGDTILVSERWF
jgi:polysaccharide export outer membrane protein